MKKQYITPATAVIKVETMPIMLGSDLKTYDSKNLGQGEDLDLMEGTVKDAREEDTTAKAFSFWEDDWE